MSRVWSTLGLAGAVLLAGGCHPVVCDETFSPGIKLLVGLPVPLVFVGLAGFGLAKRAGTVLGSEARVRLIGVASVIVACSVLPVGASLGLWLEFWTAMVVWSAAILVALATCAPPIQAWKPARWSQRLRAAVVMGVLALVILVTSAVAAMAVDRAGQVNCREHGVPGHR